jgi:Ca2+-binding RTX toxin-like protein
MAFIIGRSGADTLPGTAEADIILGLAGADIIAGREGSDVIAGGAGADSIAGDNAPLPGVPPGRDAFGPFPPPFGGTPPGDNIILAGSGDDRVWAGFGNDTVFGEEGADTILGYGTFGGSPTGFTGLVTADGDDHLSGGAGNDLILAGGGDDLLRGGDGADTLGGGVGVDTLLGGDGPDIFVFGRAVEPGTSPPAAGLDSGVGPGNRDIVGDFVQGEDRLDLSNYANIFARPGVPAEPVFLGEDPFIASFAPQVRYEIEDGRTVVQVFAPLGNPPGGLEPPVPGGPGAEIELVGEIRLTADDVILA